MVGISVGGILPRLPPCWAFFVVIVVVRVRRWRTLFALSLSFSFALSFAMSSSLSPSPPSYSFECTHALETSFQQGDSTRAVGFFDRHGNSMYTKTSLVVTLMDYRSGMTSIKHGRVANSPATEYCICFRPGPVRSDGKRGVGRLLIAVPRDDGGVVIRDVLSPPVFVSWIDEPRSRHRDRDSHDGDKEEFSVDCDCHSFAWLFSPNGARIVCKEWTHEKRCYWIFKVDTGELVDSFERASFSEFVFGPGGDDEVITLEDHKVVVRNLATGAEFSFLIPAPEIAFGGEFTAGAVIVCQQHPSLMAVVSATCSVVSFFDLTNAGALLHQENVEMTGEEALAFSPTRDFFVVAEKGNILWFRSFSSWLALGCIETGIASPIDGLVFSPNGKILLVSTQNGFVYRVKLPEKLCGSDDSDSSNNNNDNDDDNDEQ